jgi:hypothetical protein
MVFAENPEADQGNEGSNDETDIYSGIRCETEEEMSDLGINSFFLGRFTIEKGKKRKQSASALDRR